MFRLSVPMILVVSLLLLHCGGGMEEAPEMEAPMAWPEIAGYELMAVPEDNPMTEAKVALGKQLYYDQRLSGDGNRSCYGCHLQEHGSHRRTGHGAGSIRQAAHAGSTDDCGTWGTTTRCTGMDVQRRLRSRYWVLGAEATWALRVPTGPRHRMTFAPRSTRSPGMRNSSRPSLAAPQHRITSPMPSPRS